jgi:hypothetical protein
MLLFLASVLEQLDLASEHLLKGDVHNARFALMLSDNAVELVLHQIAKDKALEMKQWSHLRPKYQHTEALEKATGRLFDPKVRFARLEGNLDDETAQTISILHTYRNEVYHVGLRHQAILPALAAFHFSVASNFAGSFNPRGLGWGSNMRMPERAQKYFKAHSFFPGSVDDYRKGCIMLAAGCGHDDATFIAILADHMDKVVGEQDTCLDIVAGGVYKGQATTRDKAVIDSQAWPIAFSECGRKFAQENAWSETGSALHFVEWIAANYPLKYRRDPIASWRKRAASLRSDSNPHLALNRYHSFLHDTASLREALHESALAVESEIDTAIDRAREERAFRGSQPR